MKEGQTVSASSSASVAATEASYHKLIVQLQKSFTIVKKCTTTWTEVLDLCKPHLNSIENLAEQYQCCHSTSDLQIELLLCEFPDVKDKLLCKLQTEVERHLHQLHQHLSLLHDLCERVSKQYHYSATSYTSNSNNIDLAIVTTATPTRPSASDMLEWLQEMDVLLYQRYCARKFVLEQFCFTREETHLHSNGNIWTKDDKDVLQQLDDHLKYLSLFLDEKL